MEPDGRSAFRIAGDLYLPPTDTPGVGKTLQSLIHRFLGGDPGRRVTGCIGTSSEILTLTRRKKAGHGLLPLVRQQAADSLQIDKVDPDTDSRHQRAHQNSAKP